MTQSLDRRLHPVRRDLAARKYEGQVEAERFVDGWKRTIGTATLDFRKEPRADTSIDTQGLYGETVEVFEETAEGWAWGQLEQDGYVGWFSSDDLRDPIAATHRVSALTSFRYAGPDLKTPAQGVLSMGSHVEVIDERQTRGLVYCRLKDGSYVVKRHLRTLEEKAADWVTVAEMFLNVPYLWGGRSGAGLDCSALVQLAASESGFLLPRDSDMQEAQVGEALPLDTPIEDLNRGDLVFWKGHVGIISGKNELLHANGHTMCVAKEPLDAAIERIGANEFGAVTSFKRFC